MVSFGVLAWFSEALACVLIWLGETLQKSLERAD